MLKANWPRRLFQQKNLDDLTRSIFTVPGQPLRKVSSTFGLQLSTRNQTKNIRPVRFLGRKQCRGKKKNLKELLAFDSANYATQTTSMYNWLVKLRNWDQAIECRCVLTEAPWRRRLLGGINVNSLTQNKSNFRCYDWPRSAQINQWGHGIANVWTFYNRKTVTKRPPDCGKTWPPSLSAINLCLTPSSCFFLLIFFKFRHSGLTREGHATHHVEPRNCTVSLRPWPFLYRYLNART